MLILAIVAAVSMPVGHATNNVHTFFTNATTVGTCGTLCKGLSSTSGTGSTSTIETSLAIGSSPALDANANAVKSANWVSGTTFTVAGLSTNTATDTIIAIISNSGLVITVTGLSTPGITWDGSARTTLAPVSCAMTATEWIGHTTATLSSVTTTITLSSTPIGASAQIAAFSGSEDPSGTFNPSDKAAGFASTNSQCTGGASTPTGTSVTTLNANDMVVGVVVSSAAYTATAGTGYTLLGTATSAACGTGPGCSLGMEDQSATATAPFNCAFTAQVNRWIVICDALQSAPKYFKVEPETSASLTGTPSSAANGFSGTGWVYNVAGIQNGLFDIQSGTWQIDLTGAVGSTTGNPVARYFVTAWSCTTNSCATATLLWKNWDTATNVASSTTATPRTYTTASQSQITWTSGNFLAFEVWVAWQYSGTTTTTTMTETTISTAMDFITPGWDNAQSLSGSLTPASAFAKMSSMFKSLSGSLSSVSSFVEKTSIFKALAASITLTMGNMVANVNSGQLTCNSNPRSCSTTLTATWTMASGLAEKTSLFRSLTGSLSLTASQVKALAKSLTGSLTLASGFAEKSSLFRSLTGSLSLTASQVKGLAKALTGSLSLASGFAEKSSLFRSLTGSLSLASSFVEKNILFRSLAGSLGLAGSESKGHTFYYGSTSQTGCTVKCEQLATTTGTADTATSVKVGSSTTCCFEVQPDVGSSTTTVTPSDITPTGQAWVSPTDLGGITIQSGSWEFDTTITATKTGTANMRFLVWSCLTASEGTCTLLFDFTGTANIEATTSATKNIDVSPIEGPFSNVHFLVVEVWISPTVSTGVGAATDTMTTVSGASDVITPAWGYSQGLFATMNLASSFAEKSSLFRSLSGLLSLLGSQVAGRAFILSASLGSSSSLAEKSSLFRSLSGSLSLAASQLKRLAMTLSGSLGSVSSLAEKNSLFRSLSGSLSLSSGFAEKSSLFRSLSGSLSLAASQTKGVAKTLTGSLSSASSFAEKSSIFRSLTGSLVLASGFAEKSSLFRSLTGSLSSSSSLAEKSSLFRSLTGSLSVVGSQAKGLARALSASLSLSSGFTEKSSLFRSLTGSLSLATSQTKGLAKALAGSLTSSSSLAEKSSLFMSLTGSL